MSHLICQVEHMTIHTKQNIQLEDISFDVAENELVSIIGEDEELDCIFKGMAGLQPLQSGKVSYDNVAKRMVQYVPDDIVCYSNLTVGEFLQGMTCGVEEMAEEAARLLAAFQIETNEQLLDMTFEKNRLVAMIQSIMVRPQLLLLNRPYDMLSASAYLEILREVIALYRGGCAVVIGAQSYEDVVMACHKYIYVKDGQVIGSYKREELPKPAKVITLWGGSTNPFVADKRTMLVERNDYCRFLYQENDMKELGVRLALSGAKNYNVEELSMEEMLFGDYERWKA